MELVFFSRLTESKRNIKHHPLPPLNARSIGKFEEGKFFIWKISSK
jgi:hypothetical protein